MDTTPAAHAGLINVTIDTVTPGWIHITLDNGARYRVVFRSPDNDGPTAYAERRLGREGYKVIGRWSRTSAVTWTAQVRDWRPAEPDCDDACERERVAAETCRHTD